MPVVLTIGRFDKPQMWHWMATMFMHFGGKPTLLHWLGSLVMADIFMLSNSFNICTVIKRLQRTEKTTTFFIYILSPSTCLLISRMRRLVLVQIGYLYLLAADLIKRGLKKKVCILVLRQFLLQLQTVCGLYLRCINFEMDVQLLNFALPCC